MKPRTVYKRFKKKGQTMHNYFKIFEDSISNGSVNVVATTDGDCINAIKKQLRDNGLTT